MIKIKDRIILGIISGILAGIPGRLINAVEYRFNLTDVKYGQMATNLFLPKRKINTPVGRSIASLVNHIMISITGVITTYILSATGRDKSIIKGIGVTSIFWLLFFGLSSRLSLQVKTKKPLSPLLSFVDHVTLGALNGMIIQKIGDDALFPDAEETYNTEKIPLFHTGETSE